MRGAFSLALSALFLASGAPVPEQTLPPIPLVNPSQPPPPSEDLAFDTTEDRMTVPVSIDDRGPYDFIIDTGSERTVVSRDLAGLLGLQAGPQVHVTAMVNQAIVGTVIVPSLRVSRIAARAIEAPALDQHNMGAPGMLGIDALQGHALSIDFDKHEMTVHPSKRRFHDDSDPNEIVVKARNLFGQLIVTDAHYHGHRVAVVVDTGSPITIGNLALRAKLTKSPRQIGTVTLISALGGTLNADYMQIDQLEVGKVGFNDVPIAFANVEPFRRFQLTKEPALLLGMDALRLFHTVQIDFANREIRFTMPTNRPPTPAI